MSNKILYFNDGFDVKEQHQFNRMDSGLRGEVIMKNKDTGEVIFRKKNTILVNGKTFVLCKLFNINPPEMINLNQLKNHEMNEDPYTYTGPRRESTICLFGVGIGGADLTIGSAYPPNPREYNLYEQVPLRYVDAISDLDTEAMNRYYMRVPDNVNGKIAYYLKRFDQDPTLVRKVGSADYIPSMNDNQRIDNTSTIIQKTAVDVYVEMKFTIEATDVREWFISRNQLSNCRINEICLYTGYQPETDDLLSYNEYRGVTAFSKLTFDCEVLNSYNKSIEIIYRIYC